MRYHELMNEAAPKQQTVLVVVHPDSTCGSAVFNIGEEDAITERNQLIAELAGWHGGVIILDGGLRHELSQPAYRSLQAALMTVLAHAKASQQIAVRRVAADPAQRVVMQKLIQTLDPAAVRFYLTGAWFHGDGTGCGGDVLDVLRSAGFSATVQPSAFRL
jgi:hypothetical protein